MSRSSSFRNCASALSLIAAAALSSCAVAKPAVEDQSLVASGTPLVVTEDVTLHLDDWPALGLPGLDPAVEARIDAIMAKLTLEQKVGQVIQADSNSVTPEEVKKYRLGSVLSGGSSAPGPQPFADTKGWLEAADGYFNASIDPEGVEIAIPVIWGIDAVHGHANLYGATVFPHNIGLGAANDPDLIEEIMSVTASELVVSGHDWTFAPTLATPRDDRWGRTYEGFSESPEIVASYADRIVFGLQGHPGTDSFFADGHVISSAKHFMGDGGTFEGHDQGDARISEEEMRAIHAQGYISALQGGVQTVMASFSSWDGIKMHGSKAMLTDLLKGRFGFNGFIVGDWNGHGQVPGCTNTDCPQSLNAGLDMYMAPDSWKGLYESTLKHVQAGEIPMERLDDAVRRILRVKIAYGLFEKGPPSTRPGAGDEALLGSKAHHEVARRAVRESLVLLKNNGGVLPLKAGQTVLVVGDGADNIGKQAGGWTLSWQGGDFDNTFFPNGETILEGIRETVLPAGGTVIFDPEGTSTADADVVIAVYGENAYAEGFGDLKTLDFAPNGFDTAKLDNYKARGVPVVSVFLSGRPLWVNPEINDSNAFVAAFLPGTEGGGVADVLFQSSPEYDFRGRLSYSWPKTAESQPLNKEMQGYDPLFAYGYGLSYADAPADMAELSEDPGEIPQSSVDVTTVFARGEAGPSWMVMLYSEGQTVPVDTGTVGLDGLMVSRTDYGTQEDALLLEWVTPDAHLVFAAPNGPVDLSSVGGSVDVVFSARVPDGSSMPLTLFGGCTPDGTCAGSEGITVAGEEWADYSVAGICIGLRDLRAANMVASFSTSAPGTIGLANVRIVEHEAGPAACEN